MRNQIEHCKVKQNSDERLWSEGVREEWRHVERERERGREGRSGLVGDRMWKEVRCEPPLLLVVCAIAPTNDGSPQPCLIEGEQNTGWISPNTRGLC